MAESSKKMSAKYHHLTVKEIIQETPDTVTISFWHPVHQAIGYKSGQFLTLMPVIDGKKVRRSYSMSSSPNKDASIAVTVKRVKNGLVSNWLNDNVKVGDAIEVMDPMGHFIIEPNPTKTREIVLFGAGSGVTPLMSMLKSVLPVESNTKVYLIYGSRTEQDIIFKKQLDELEHKYPNLKVDHVLSQPNTQTWFGLKGRIDEGLAVHLLRQEGVKMSEAEYYLCGPEAMMAQIQRGLKIFNVPAENIHIEHFTNAISLHQEQEEEPEDDGSLKEQTVTIKYEGKSYDLVVKPHETILEAALDQDIDLPYSCQAGMCTACMAKCTEGKVKLDEEDGLTKKELDQGFILTCVAHPIGKGVVIEVE